ncbi:MAG TPA: RDD family protein [Moraxellaceae bacterium]|nr:RDD family protein [Moraxellaceae bacterium]
MSRKKSRSKASPAPDATPVSAIAAAPAGASAEPAGMLVRLFCLTYDGLLLVALWMVTGALLVPLGTPAAAARQHQIALVSPAFQNFVLTPSLVAVTWLFYGYFWTRAGQTLGMQTWRLRVLRADGSRLRWTDAITRCAAACLFPLVCGLMSRLAFQTPSAFLLSISLGFLGNYLWMMWNPRHLTWHDQLSATQVWRLPPEPKGKRRLLGWFAEKGE